MKYDEISPFGAYSLLVTENCNLACKYCYELNSSGHKKNKMKISTARQCLEFMFEQANMSKGKRLSVCFFGGEPTLAMDVIDYICTEGKRRAEGTPIDFSVNIITNATLMNEKIYNIFKKHINLFSSCQLSVDGPHDIQDSNRVTKSGRGTFNTIEHNLKYWKSLFGDKLNVHGVLSKDSIGRLFESYKYFREVWKVKKLWFLPCKDDRFTEEDAAIYDEEMNKIYSYIMNIVRKNKSLNEIEYYAPIDRCLRNGKSDKPCGAGDTYCTITADGDIFPCHHIYYIDAEKETCLGNIWGGVDLSKKYMWAAYDNNDMVGCKDCDHPSCYRCIAENYEKYKTPFTQIKGVHCKFMYIDLKYQKLIRREIEKMGLIGSENTGENSGMIVRDCVGKIGDCDVVTRLEDCKFDRKDCTQFSASSIPKEFDQIETETIPPTDKPSIFPDANKCEGCSPGINNKIKEDAIQMLDEVIAVLVKYHTKWKQEK